MESSCVLTQTLSPDDYKKIVCNICKQQFSSNATLRRHIRRHTDGRSFLCEFCEKSFYRKDCLRNHKRIHFDEKPFTCDICSHTSNSAYRMKIHKKKTHKITFEEKKIKKKHIGAQTIGEQNGKKKYRCKRKEKENVEFHELIAENKIESKKENIEIINLKAQFKENKSESKEKRLKLKTKKDLCERQKTDLSRYNEYKEKTRHHKRHDVFNFISTIIFESHDQDLVLFFKNLKTNFYNELFFQLLDKNKFQWYFVLTTTLTRINSEGYSDYLILHLRTEMVTQLNEDYLLESIEEEFLKITKRYEEFNAWTFLNVNFLELNIAKF